MPPPNITGKLHAGHAMFTTLQDILIRFRRMQGYDALWIPGTDHAGLATQKKLDEEMIARGLDPAGPEFHAFADKYKQTLSNTINDQLRRTGSSCDWSMYRFTLDDQYTIAINEAFNQCHDILYKENGQWYLDMRDLAKELLDHIDRGELEIIPQYQEKTLRNFLENIEPWCISRQIRWGHKIPIDGEDDVLDTWFSSALWPFAILGWPAKTPEFEKYYPAAAIETADDILFFWCARMLMMGLKLTGQLPFKSIYLHGIMRDENGDKMSKSLGNGIDPLEIINTYGCDAMRFALAENATPGQDTRIYIEKFESAKSLRIKLWNAARFSLPLMEEGNTHTHCNDAFLLEKIRQTKVSITESLEKFEIHLAAFHARHLLYDFCGNYIEESKDRLYSGDISARNTLYTAFNQILRIFHLFMPFVTEEIARHYGKQLITAEW